MEALSFSNLNNIVIGSVWIAIISSSLAFFICAVSKATPLTLYIWGVVLLAGAGLSISALWTIDYVAFAGKHISESDLRFLSGRIQSAILIASIFLGAGGINLITTGISRK